MSSSSVVPVVLWGSTPPSHCISCIITTYDQKTIVTGSSDGQLGVWDLRFAEDGGRLLRLRSRLQKLFVSNPGGGGGGGTWVFFGWVCAAQDSKLAPRSKKKFP